MPRSKLIIQEAKNEEDSNSDSQTAILMLPQRKQTLEQSIRTHLFAIEFSDLLSKTPQFQIPFNKFIPAYHHAFNRQCRVADYGFTKLVELLEALPHIAEVWSLSVENYPQ